MPRQQSADYLPHFNPFLPELIILAKPLNPEIKWWRPEDKQSGLVLQLLVPSFGRNGSSKDFIVYSCVPEEL